MSLPKELNLFGTLYAIEETDLGDEDAGSSQQIFRTIHIDKSIPLDAKWETLGHETMHVIMQHLGLDYLLDEQHLETFCQALGVAWIFIIAANREQLLGIEKPSLGGQVNE